MREKLRAGEPTIGCFLGLGSPNAAELLAHAGFDWLVIETEHNGLDSAEVEHMLMAMNGTDAIPIVRVPPASPVFIQRALDLGGLGVLAPLVKTPAEVEGIVAATRFPPEGVRSFGPLRASRYTLDYEEYLARANDNIVVSLIIETKEAVENLASIAAIPGVDVLFLGLFDLCLSIGLNPNKLPHPEVDEIIDQALAVGREHQVAVGIGVGTPDELTRRLEQGFTFIVYATDYFLLLNAARAGVAAFSERGGGSE